MGRNIAKDRYGKNPAKIPSSITSKNYVTTSQIDGRVVWRLYPKNSNSEIIILYLHGGAYHASITSLHWTLITKLLEKTGAAIIVPDYPLAPQSTCKETYLFLDELYEKILGKYHSKRIIFIGDSAGGGLAFGFAQQLRNEGKIQPEHIILYSPWLDASMNNPKLKELESIDKILNLKGLREAGENYAGSIEINDFKVSPLFGELQGLGKISIFSGTDDLLNADAKRLKEKAEEADICLNFFEYNGMFHDWMLVPFLGATHDVVHKTARLTKTS